MTKAASAQTASTREGDDEGGVEPVLALAQVEHELQAAEAEHHQHEAEHVHAPRLRW